MIITKTSNKSTKKRKKVTVTTIRTEQYLNIGQY